MVGILLFCAQGNPGLALVQLVSIAGVVIVPATVIMWAKWFDKPRPRSVGILVYLSIPFLIWLLATVAWCTEPSPEEEFAVEQVMSACPALDTSSWRYSADRQTSDNWLITVKGKTSGGTAFRREFHVTPFEVAEAAPDSPGKWITLKRWPLPGDLSSRSTSRPESP